MARLNKFRSAGGEIVAINLNRMTWVESRTEKIARIHFDHTCVDVVDTLQNIEEAFFYGA